MPGGPTGDGEIPRLAARALVFAALIVCLIAPTAGSPATSQASAPAGPAIPSAEPRPAPAETVGPRAELQWVDLNNLSPPPLTKLVSGTLAFDPALDEAVYFGGASEPASFSPGSNGTWAFSNGAWSSVASADTPPAADGSDLAYDPALGGVVLVDVPATTSTSAAYTWEYASTGWTNLSEWGNVTPAASAAMAYDPPLGGLVRFGGVEMARSHGQLSDATEILTGAAWENLTVTGSPPALSGATAAYDPALEGVVLYGGSTSNHLSNQTWLFANGSWRQLHPARVPPALAESTAVWDPPLDGLLLEGGAGPLNAPFAGQDRSWLFQDGNWTPVPEPAAAPVAAWSAATYDPAVGGVLNVGGYGAPGNSSSELSDPGPLSEVWLTTVAPAVLPTVSGGPYEAGVPVGFRNRLPNDTPNETSAWAFGDGTSVDASTTAHTYASGGTFLARLSASIPLDGGSSTTTANVTLDVAPELTAVPRDPDPSIDEHHALSLAVTLDGGIAPIAVNWTFGDGNGTSGGPRVVHTFGAVGNFTVDAVATDALGVVRTASFLVHVEPFAQVALSVGASVLDLGQSLSVAVLTRNGSGPYEYAYDGLPDGCVSANVSDLVCVPTVTGVYQVTAIVTDSDGIYVESPSVVVAIAPPLAGAVSESANVVDVGSSITVTTTLSSDGSGDVALALPTGLGCAADASGSAVCTPSAPGRYPVSVTARDLAGGVLEITGTPIVVHPDLSFGLVGPSGPVPRGQPYYVGLNAGGGTLPYRFSESALPAACLFLNATEIRCYPGLAGVYRINATATDAVGGVSLARLAVVVTGAPLQAGPAAPPAPPPTSGLDDTWLWAVVAAAVAEVVLSLRFSHRRRDPRARRAGKLLWSELGSADPDASDLDRTWAGAPSPETGPHPESPVG